MNKLRSMFLACTLLYPGFASSQVLVDTISLNSDLSLGPVLSFSKVEYKNENDSTFEVKRKTLGLGLVYKVNPDVGVLFQAAHTLDAEFENSDLDDGEGYMLGTGVNFVMYNQGKLSLLGYGLINYVNDTYDKFKPKHEMDVTDIHLGMLMAVKANRTVTFYGGLELIPYSEGSIKRGKYETDIERDEMLNLKLGLDFTFPNMNLKPEVTLIGEKTFTVSAGFNI